jgi:hypothetical protein
MADEIGSPNRADAPTRTLEVEDETGRLLDAAATQEGRPVALVLEDAVQLYIWSRSEGYRTHLELARRFLDAPRESEERALAGAELSAGLARERGRERQDRGGDVAEIRARLRRRQAPVGDS